MYSWNPVGLFQKYYDLDLASCQQRKNETAQLEN